MLRLKVQEREVRETRIESETAILLIRNESLDEELKAEMEEFTSMRERMASPRKKNKAFHSNMFEKLQRMREKHSVHEQESNTGPDYADPRETGKTRTRKLSTNLHFWAV